MPRRRTTADLEAYLDEALPAAEMAAIEADLRTTPQLVEQLALINARRDSGTHTLGEIWRRNRLSCPSREELEQLLEGSLTREQADYHRFHLTMVGCRYCQANFADLERQQAEARNVSEQRRTKIFQSSAGRLRRDGK